MHSFFGAKLRMLICRDYVIVSSFMSSVVIEIRGCWWGGDRYGDCRFGVPGKG